MSQARQAEQQGLPQAQEHTLHQEAPPVKGFQRLDFLLTKSWFGRYFECEQRYTSVLQEVRAGVVCFLTVAYIIPVNAGILTSTGGSCDPSAECTADGWKAAAVGHPNGDGSDCKYTDPGYASCMRQFQDDAIASTCISAMLATFLMAWVARMPLAVAPAMSINAYFSYTVVGYLGGNSVSYKQALSAVFVEGWIFVLLTITGVRGRIMEMIPKNIMYATSAGIGCFLGFVGLQQSEGIGLITFSPSTLVKLGACPPDQRGYMYTLFPWQINQTLLCGTDDDGEWLGPSVLGPPSSVYECLGAEMHSATTWLGIFTGALMVLLMMKDVKASILIGILFCTFISWIPTHAATYLGDSSPIPGGADRYTYFRKGAVAPSIKRTGGQLDFSALGTADVWLALLTFLYLDFLDATSTMFAMARLVAEDVPGFVNEKGQWPRQMWTMCMDGLGIVIGSLLGCSPLQVFPESAVGIREGGRTGITSLVVAFGFGISMFLSPIFASIPPYATGPAIVLVGALMMENAKYVHWEDIRQAAPAFITILLMPLTYSIAYGIICGLGLTIFLWLCDTLWEIFNVVRGVYKGQKTLYHVWLDSMSSVYIALGKETTLIKYLPGFRPPEVLPNEADSHMQNPQQYAEQLQLYQQYQAQYYQQHLEYQAAQIMAMQNQMVEMQAAHAAQLSYYTDRDRPSSVARHSWMSGGYNHTSAYSHVAPSGPYSGTHAAVGPPGADGIALAPHPPHVSMSGGGPPHPHGGAYYSAHNPPPGVAPPAPTHGPMLPTPPAHLLGTPPGYTPSGFGRQSADGGVVRSRRGSANGGGLFGKDGKAAGGESEAKHGGGEQGVDGKAEGDGKLGEPDGKLGAGWDAIGEAEAEEEPGSSEIEGTGSPDLKKNTGGRKDEGGGGEGNGGGGPVA